MVGKKGTSGLPRGSRVMVTFPVSGPERLPLRWTGHVLGPSPLPGRVRVRSDYVTWKGPLHLLPEGDPSELGGYRVDRIPKHSPIEYHEDRPNGRHVVREA